MLLLSLLVKLINLQAFFVSVVILTKSMYVYPLHNISNSLDKLITEAISAANESDGVSYKHGAVLFSNGTVLSTGHNCPGNKMCGFDVPSHHAEASSLKKHLRGKQCCFLSRKGEEEAKTQAIEYPCC